MSNPLLRPDDPRFRPKQLPQDGNNPFAEGGAILDAEATAPARNDGHFAAPASQAERPFVPQYETTADHRALLLLSLDAISGLALLSALGVSVLGWVFPLLGLIPAGVTLFLAAEDLRTMRLGGRDRAGRGLTILALVLSLFLLLLLGLVIYAFVSWEIEIMPPSLR